MSKWDRIFLAVYVAVMLFAMAFFGSLALQKGAAASADTKHHAQVVALIEKERGSAEFSSDIAYHLIEAGQKHSVPLSMLLALTYEESRFRPDSLSSAGCRGLLQVCPIALVELGRAGVWPRMYEIAINIDAGAEFIAWQLRRANGNTLLALSRYNGLLGSTPSPFGHRVAARAKRYAELLARDNAV